MKRTVIYHERPIAAYNADKQELIGLFERPSVLGRYLFDETRPERSTKRACDSLKSNSRICNSRFPFKIALRFANEVQIELLGGEEFLILNGYPAMRKVDSSYVKTA